jgi:agmatinase
MSDVPTFATPGSFLGIAATGPGAPICIAGIPFDIATTNRSGARFGPHAIRHASRMLVDGDHPATWRHPGALPLADIGDFRIALGDLGQSLELIETQALTLTHLIALGGDHSVTLPLLRALRRRHEAPLALIHFDAHVDTWPDSFGQVYGHGSPFFHAINEGLIAPERTVQIGIRSPVSRAVHDWTTGRGVTIIPAMAVHEDRPERIADRVRDIAGDGPVYLSFDIDALDPAFAPGTGTPEVGGLATWQVQAILRRLAGLAFAGMDLVEVSPPYDVAEITALAGATIIWEYLALLQHGR